MPGENPVIGLRQLLVHLDSPVSPDRVRITRSPNDQPVALPYPLLFLGSARRVLHDDGLVREAHEQALLIGQETEAGGRAIDLDVITQQLPGAARFPQFQCVAFAAGEDEAAIGTVGGPGRFSGPGRYLANHLSVLKVPEQDPSARVRGQEEFAVQAETEVDDLRGVALKNGHLLPPGDVPDPDQVVVTPDGQHIPVRGIGQTADRSARVGLGDRVGFPFAVHIPDEHVPLLIAGGDLVARRIEGQTEHLAFVSLQGGRRRLPGRGVPEDDLAVRTGRGGPLPVSGIGHPTDLSLVACRLGDHLARLHIPDAKIADRAALLLPLLRSGRLLSFHRLKVPSARNQELGVGLDGDGIQLPPEGEGVQVLLGEAYAPGHGAESAAKSD